MSRSVRLVVFLLLSVFVLDRGLGFLIEKLYWQKPPAPVAALDYIANEGNGHKILILGSSRALHSLDPQLMTQNTFNMGWDGTAIDMHLTIIKILEAHNQLPETVVLTLDEKVVFDMGVDYVGIENLSVLYNEEVWVREVINKQSRYNALLYFFSLYKFNGKMVGILNPGKAVFNAEKSGYVPLKPDPRGAEKIQKLIERKALAAQSDPQKSFDLNPKFIDNFDELLKLIKAHNKRLIVLSTPSFGPDSFDPDKQVLYEFMCAKGVPYLDYRNKERLDHSLVSDVTLWKDLSHLNSRGAELFTRYFDKDLQRILADDASDIKGLSTCQ